MLAVPKEKPAEKHPDKGATMGCRVCMVAHLDVPEFDWRDNPTPGEQFDVIRKVAEARGWGSDVDPESREAFLVCPGCLRRGQEATDRVLPRFAASNRCAKCGGAKVGTKFCNGRQPSCALGAVRDHLHRVCRNCGFTWIEGCLDDPKTAKAGGE